MKPSAYSRLRRLPPDTAPSSASSASTPWIAGTAAASTSAATPLARGQLVQVAEQAEAGDVGQRVGARAARGRARPRR